MEIEELLVKLNFNGEEAKKGMNAVVSDLHGISENAKDSFLHAGSEVKSFKKLLHELSVFGKKQLPCSRY